MTGSSVKLIVSYEARKEPLPPGEPVSSWCQSRQPVAESVESALERLAAGRERDAQGPLAARPVGRAIDHDDPRITKQEPRTSSEDFFNPRTSTITNRPPSGTSGSTPGYPASVRPPDRDGPGIPAAIRRTQS